MLLRCLDIESMHVICEDEESPVLYLVFNLLNLSVFKHTPKSPLNKRIHFRDFHEVSLCFLSYENMLKFHNRAFSMH